MSENAKQFNQKALNQLIAETIRVHDDAIKHGKEPLEPLEQLYVESILKMIEIALVLLTNHSKNLTIENIDSGKICFETIGALNVLYQLVSI